MRFQVRLRRFRPGSGTIASLIVALWPFVYLASYLVTIMGLRLRPGNDFLVLYYRYKHYLLDVMATEGRIPLWSPSEAAGYPFFSNPFAAAFYPLNIPLAVFYRLVGGYSPYYHMVFTIAGLSIFSVGLHRWLRSLGTPLTASAFTAMAVGTSLRMTEILRLPNAVHAAAWIPWLLYGLTLATRSRGVLKGAALSAGSLAMLVTAGYPYYGYYLVFLVPPYLACLLIPRVRRAIAPAGEPRARPVVALAASAGGIAAGALLCLPYLWKVKQLLSQTGDRTGRDFSFSTAHEWGVTDTLGSLVYPPAAMAEGWYFLGVANLVVMTAFVVEAIRDRRTRPDDLVVVGTVGLWWALVTYITFGKHSLLFHVLWRWFPGFSSLRVWPRLNVVLLPLLAILLARAFAYLGSVLSATDGERPGRAGRVLAASSASYAAILALQVLLHGSGQVNAYWTAYLDARAQGWPMEFQQIVASRLGALAAGVVAIAVSKAWFLLSGAAGFAVLAMLLAVARRRALRQEAVAASLLLVFVMEVAPLGLRQWAGPGAPGDVRPRALQVRQAIRASLVTSRSWTYDTIQLRPPFSVGTVSNWYFGRYIQFLHRSSISPDRTPTPEEIRATSGLERLMGLVDGRRLFVTRQLDHATVQGFLDDASATESECGASVRVADYDGDRLEAIVATGCEAYLSFVDNWDPDWRARADGRDVAIELLFGTFKAVRVGPGTRRVEFAYVPF